MTSESTTMLERYSRQILFDGIGETGQRRLLDSRAAIIGCGALGAAQAEALARAGVGRLRLVDRDFVDRSNLQRQTMYTEQDAEERLPKAVACERHLGSINSEIATEAEILDVRAGNVERIVKDCDVVLDGTDNFTARYLINDACVKHNINWIYGAAVGSYGVTMTVRPGITPCLRCIFEEVPPPGSAPTCDTAGVIMPVISIVAAMQVSEALKLLTGQADLLHNSLMQFDVWRNDSRRIRMERPALGCPACDRREFGSLQNDGGEFAAVLCGRDAVQLSPPVPAEIDLVALAGKLRVAGAVKANEYLLRFSAGAYELTVFRDARSIIRGTDDIALARSLYARYVGA